MGETDQKIPDTTLSALASNVYDNHTRYLEAKKLIAHWLIECTFEKDIVLLQKLLKTSFIPMSILRNIRDEIVYLQFDNYIIQNIRIASIYNGSFEECYSIDLQSSPRLKNFIRKHNEHCFNIKWLASFQCWPQDVKDNLPLNIWPDMYVYSVSTCPMAFLDIE